MFKGLIRTVKGIFREKANDATDLRYAGKETLIDIQKKINAVNAERNRLAGSGKLAEAELAKREDEAVQFAAAVKAHNESGDVEKKERAYAVYTEKFAAVEEQRTVVAGLIKAVADVDASLNQLEKEKAALKNRINKAATTQQVGRANRSIETLHTEMESGAGIGGAIDQAEEMAATAEATREQRKGKDHSDLLVPTNKAPSMDDLCK